MIDKPLARPLEPVPLQDEGRQMIALKDTSGLGQGMAVLQPAAYMLWTLMDGETRLEEIAEKFHQHTGMVVEVDLIAQLVANLDSCLALDGPKARARLAEMDVRPASHAGGAYPSDPQDLEAFLNELLALEEHPAPPEGKSLVGVLAPHIDLRRGAASYCKAYGELKAEKRSELTAIVLGISHAPARTPFILTHKDFATPLGKIETDVELVERLAGCCEFDPFLDEYNHFGEHSIEFQAVFLRHLYPKNLKMVPVLCGSFHEALQADSDPRELEGVKRFLEGLAELCKERPEVVVIAGADLAHVGVTFGGAPLTLDDLAALERADLESLARAVEADGSAFFKTLVADCGSRGYCGTSAIFTMVEALQVPGTLHRYQQCNEPGNTSTVTVAAAGFYA